MTDRAEGVARYQDALAAPANVDRDTMTIIALSTKRARTRALLSALLLSAFLLQGCKKSDDAAPAAQVNVQAEKPEIGDISERVTADATLSPMAQAAITPKISRAPAAPSSPSARRKVKRRRAPCHPLENTDLSAYQALDNEGQYKAAQAIRHVDGDQGPGPRGLPEGRTRRSADQGPARPPIRRHGLAQEAPR